MAERKYKCKVSPDQFCYVCGCKQKRGMRKISSVGSNIAEAYQSYFGFPITDQDKNWAPHVICNDCRRRLDNWQESKFKNRAKMPFAVPRIWTEPSNHTSDCYFCYGDQMYWARKIKLGLTVFDYPHLASSRRPAKTGSHKTLTVPESPSVKVSVQLNLQRPSTSSSDEDEPSPNVETAQKPSKPHVISREELDDLCRDIGLTKQKSELLASRLKQWNLLDPNCKITSFRKRHEQFSDCYKVADNDQLVVCNDISNLFSEMDVCYSDSEWRLFIDSSKVSLKAVLLHNGNIYPSIPVGYSTHMKETYDNVKYLLENLKYVEHEWDVIADFKMIGFLRGLQGGYTRHMCYLCLWDSRADAVHYKQKVWPSRTEHKIGSHNINHEELIPIHKVLLPPLHITLGLFKQLVKAMFKFRSAAYEAIRNMFPELSDAKVQGGIFTGPQIRKCIQHTKDLESVMNSKEKAAFLAFQTVVSGFLGGFRSPYYEEQIEHMIKCYQEVGCRMSLKLHMMHSHLDEFKDNLSDYSEQHGERFHQDMKDMEARYMRQCNETMMGDYIWGLQRDSDTVYKKKRLSMPHFKPVDNK
jgi:hypothetical protein